MHKNEPIYGGSSVSDLEQWLLARLAEPQADRGTLQRMLASFYCETGRYDRSQAVLEALVSETNDVEQQAGLLLSLGQVTEKKKDFTTALAVYGRAQALEPLHPKVRYLIHNNQGYCLIQLERYEEAETHCRIAIALNPVRHNAHKNLGLALAGQNQSVEAVESFVQAVHANPNDPRALRHLEDLIAQYPHLLTTPPGLTEKLADCREAVRHATLRRRASRLN